MKYYLVDKYDDIVTKVELGDDIGVSGARTYFLGIKQLEEDSFDKLWKVMTEDQYDLHFKNNLYDRQMGKRKYEWWKDEPSGPDDGFDY
tara:strand:+ start:334 stop:600 length:267 start_codon:yes stop_codon:yes gene_type:complete